MPIQNITDTRAVAHSLQKERVTSKEQPCFMETRWKPTGPDTGLDAATSAAGDISALFVVLLLPSPLLIVRPGQLDMTLDRMSS